MAAGVIALWLVPVAGQSPAARATKAAASGPAPRTAWGTPDLQGIWQNQVVIPFERPTELGTREFLTDKEVADREQARLKQIEENKGRDRRDASAERDVAGAYNAIWQGVPVTQIGKRTSTVVDPPDGRIPPMTPEASKRVAGMRAYLLALLQATDTCKRQLQACRGGEYGPVSPRRAELPPEYNLDRMNRSDGPEDRSAGERCLGGQLPQIGTLQRIVQGPDAVTVYYDIGQGGGFSRVIPISNTPHLPSSIRQKYGDARGHWEGDTLVVDVTNFTNETEFRGSRENLHLIERYTRTGANVLTYKVTVQDPTTWTKPWTAIADLAMQDEKANEVYQQTCHEGNYGLTGMLANTRAAELAYAEGRGPDPALQDNASGGGGED